MRLAGPLLLVALSLSSLRARGDAVDVQLHPKAALGKGDPDIAIRILEPIAGFHLDLTRSDGTKVDVKGGGKPGQSRVIPLPQPEGKFSYQGTLTVSFADAQTGSMPLAFETEVLGPLQLTFEKADLDLAARKLTFKLSRPVRKVHVRVLMDTGKVACDADVPFSGEAAGTPLTVSWPGAEGKVMRIAVTAFDTSSFYTGVELSPWQLDIPHEEVLFDTGKWEVRADQKAKLDDSVKKISEVLAKYGSIAPIRLFIAGHTDTVGSSESNRTLSLNRARSIGEYFRQRGIRIPILYEGFGEEALMVGTKDETPEERNRRVEYIVAIEDPVMKGTSFQPSWRKL